MLSKDLVKGMRVVLKNGWEADVMAKPKGTRIFLKVYGFETEMGDCWLKDVATVVTPAGRYEALELNDKQKKEAEKIAKLEAMIYS